MKYVVMPKTKAQAQEAKPADWPFMEQSAKMLADFPETWRQYPDTTNGAMAIITMEYEELMRQKDAADKMRESVHLASACLHLWRMLHANA